MSDARGGDYFLSKAGQCFRLADRCTDEAVASRLRELGYEFVEQALEAGVDPANVPKRWRRPSG